MHAEDRNLLNSLGKAGKQRSRSPKIPKALLEQLYYDERLTQRQIAEQLGVSDSLIRKKLKEYGILTRTKFEVSKDILQYLYWQEGLTLEEIGQHFNVSRKTIGNLMASYSIPTRAKNLPKLSKDELERLYYQERLTQKQIGEYFGIGETSVRKKMKEYGLTRRTITDELNLSPTELEQLYLVEKRSGIEIANFYGCEEYIIYDLLRKYNIPLRYNTEITKEQLEQLYYHEGLTQHEVANRLGVSTPTLRAWMKKYGLKKKTRPDYMDIPKVELERLYLIENRSTVEIAEMYGCAASVIQNRLKEHGIPTKPGGWDKVKQIVPDARLTWSPAFAYAVGLIASDGNLSKGTNEVKIASTDRDIVEGYCWGLGLRPSDIPAENWADPNAVEIPVHIEHRPPYKKQYHIVFSDYVYRARLEEIGLISNKSNTLGPLQVPDEYFRDFLRGEFDGDGGFHVDRRDSRNYLIAYITSGSPLYLEWLNNTIQRLAGIGKGRIYRLDLWYAGEKAGQLGQFLYYQPDLPCLRRKRDIWQDWLGRKNGWNNQPNFH